jgi:hypothetical protein
VSALAAAALVVTSCNGDTSDEPGALSKSEFAKKANSLCADTEAERTRLFQQLPPQHGEAHARTFERMASADRELVRRVDALVPPDAQQDRVDHLLDEWRKRAELEEQYAKDVRSMRARQTDDTFTMELLEIDATAASIAGELELTQCIRGLMPAGLASGHD